LLPQFRMPLPPPSPHLFRDRTSSPFLILGLERLATASLTAARNSYSRLMQVRGCQLQRAGVTRSAGGARSSSRAEMGLKDAVRLRAALDCTKIRFLLLTYGNVTPFRPRDEVTCSRCRDSDKKYERQLQEAVSSCVCVAPLARASTSSLSSISYKTLEAAYRNPIGQFPPPPPPSHAPLQGPQCPSPAARRKWTWLQLRRLFSSAARQVEQLRQYIYTYILYI
jgi:hypothetical protein